MFAVTRIRGGELYLNPDLVEAIEATPDTHIRLVDGKHLIVAESPETIVDRIAAWRARVITDAAARTTAALEAGDGADRAGSR